jgi:hypothetical protein
VAGKELALMLSRAVPQPVIGVGDPEKPSTYNVWPFTFKVEFQTTA